jgi:hypothetical protein
MFGGAAPHPVLHAFVEREHQTLATHKTLGTHGLRGPWVVATPDEKLHFRMFSTERIAHPSRRLIDHHLKRKRFMIAGDRQALSMRVVSHCPMTSK